MRSVIICILHNQNQIKKNETAGTCHTNDNDKNCIQNFSRETNRRDHLEDIYVDGRTIILKWVLNVR
jgi:hypothetical protein